MRVSLALKKCGGNMAPRSSISTLPEKLRHELERKLAENGFANYTELTEWLNNQGYQISRSAVHRYGQKVERRFAAIKASTEAARFIAEGAADEGDTRSEALMAMLQTELFDALVQIGEMNDEQLDPLDRFGVMAEGAKKISGLISASTRLKTFQAAQREKLAKKFAELEAESQKQNSTLDIATLQRIRQEVYGVI